MDAPDFNLGLEKTLKAHGIPTIHYVSPSVWAWRRERVKTIAQSVTHILALFPFEPKIYEEAGVPVTYVGHPMADVLPEQPDRAAMRAQLKLPPRETSLPCFPVAGKVNCTTWRNCLSGLRRKLPVLNRMSSSWCRWSAAKHEIFLRPHCTGCGADLPLKILFGHAHAALIAANVALVASGTATLETALLRRPMVITYKLSRFSAFLMRRKGYLPYVGLPNVLAGRFIVPELLQEDATPDNLAQALLNLLHDAQVQTGLDAEFQLMQDSLRQNTAERASEVVLHYLSQGSRA